MTDTTPDSPDSDSNPPRLAIVVEDDPRIARLIQITLEREGYQVNGYGNGRDGLEAAITLAPLLIVLDLGLPDIDGREVLRRLRSHPRTEPIQLIICSSSTDLLTSAERRLTQAVLTKPFRISELQNVIRLITDRPSGNELDARRRANASWTW